MLDNLRGEAEPRSLCLAGAILPMTVQPQAIHLLNMEIWNASFQARTLIQSE